MKKFSVHVILPHPNNVGSSFHSVVVEADGVVAENGYYAFYKKNGDSNIVNQQFAYYPIQHTVIEPHNPSPAGASGSNRQ